MFNDLTALILHNDAVGFLPGMFAITLGTVHSPSYFGIFLAIFIEWLAVSLPLALLWWGINGRWKENAT